MEKITLWKHGFQLERHGVKAGLKSRGGLFVGTRGTIRGWSKASRRRLRRALCELSGDGFCFGVTCTIPAFDCDMDTWRGIVHRFRMSLIYRRIAGIYRVELQQNKSPHLHLVCWVKDLSSVLDIWELWLDSLHRVEFDDDKYGIIRADQVDGAMLHAVHVQRIPDDSISAYRYLADHASKRKQAQLGYKGRNWGFINKKFLHQCKVAEFALSDRQYDVVLRFIRRLSHCHVSRGNFGRTVWFTFPETMRRIIDFVKGSVAD